MTLRSPVKRKMDSLLSSEIRNDAYSIFHNSMFPQYAVIC